MHLISDTLLLLLFLFIQGFVAAVSPFNFTAIGGNLAGAPALMVRNKNQQFSFFLRERLQSRSGSVKENPGSKRFS